MNPQRFTTGILLLSAVSTAACDSQKAEIPQPDPASTAPVAQPAAAPPETVKEPAVTGTGHSDAIELEWDVLIPADWRLDTLLDEYDAENLGDLSDDDPRAKELMEKMKQFWREAPVVHDYDGKTVKLPGFVVPLEMDATNIREFLLVPYYGACIHTPPPPANQTVYVMTDEERAYRGELFDIVWVTGTMKVEKLSSEMGDAGYRIEATKVEAYE